MNICDFGHDEICFQGINCPLCEMKDDKDSELLALKEEIVDLKAREKAEEPA